MIRKLWTLFKRAGWAPLAVLILHRLSYDLGWRDFADPILHFLGGLAIAFFLYHAIALFLDPKRKLSPLIHLAFTFTAACTVAVFWEFAEFASDHFRGSNIQHSIHETMMDLVYGTIGAALTVTLLALIKKANARRKRKNLIKLSNLQSP